MSTLDPVSAPASTAPSSQPAEPAAAPDWKAQIDQSFRDAPIIKNTKDINALAKQLIDAEKFVGNSIRVPTDGAPPEEVEKFHRKLGRPESVDKYSKLDYSKMPEGYAPDDKRVSEFYQAAFKSGLSDRQAKEILQWHHQQDIETIKSEGATSQASREKAEAELKTRFGSAYDERIALAKQAYKKIADDTLREQLRAGGYEDNPAFIAIMAEVGKSLIDDRTIDGSSGVSSLTLTTMEARGRIQDIMNDKSHPYHSGREDAVNEVTKLYDRAYPAGAQA